MEKRLEEISLPLWVSDSIYLDIIQQKDTNSFFYLLNSNRNYLRQGISWLDQCQTIEQTMLFIGRSLKDIELNQSIRLGIFLTEQLVGAILLTAHWRNQAFEVGYWIAPSFQSKGIVTMSCSSILKTIFKEFDVKKVLIHTTVSNTKSQSVAKHLGFIQQENSAHQQWLYNQYVDCVWYEKNL